MATADHLKALIRSHAEGDDERFFAIALQVAAQAARQGHTKFAQELRDLVDQAKARPKAVSTGQRTRPVPIVQPRGELAGLLTAAFPRPGCRRWHWTNRSAVASTECFWNSANARRSWHTGWLRCESSFWWGRRERARR